MEVILREKGEKRRKRRGRERGREERRKERKREEEERREGERKEKEGKKEGRKEEKKDGKNLSGIVGRWANRWTNKRETLSSFLERKEDKMPKIRGGARPQPTPAANATVEGVLIPEFNAETGVKTQEVMMTADKVSMFYMCRAYSEENRPGYHRIDC